jgi:tRNA(Arg) A34 adenosine deaminase TadA
MCLAAIYWARLESVTFAAGSEDAAAAGFDDSHIDTELRRPHAERRLKILQSLREEAVEAFTRWRKKHDRVQY